MPPQPRPHQPTLLANGLTVLPLLTSHFPLPTSPPQPTPDPRPLTPMLPTLPTRPPDGHKGTFGRISVIGGSAGLSGAVCLASLAALRSGSGLVTACVPRSLQILVAASEPCIMTVGLPDNDGHLLPPDTTLLTEVLSGRDAVACGPGLGRSPQVLDWPQQLLRHATCPLVLDADALHPALPETLRQTQHPACIITPHPGEFSRLTGLPIATISADRERLAAEFARLHQVIVVLKGPGTVVTDGNRTFVNTTGNSGMGTGGSGDVLTGIVVSLLGQGLDPFEAAAIAVYAHGAAGDFAAQRFTPRAMIASDLITCLPDAWRLLEAPRQTHSP